MALPLETLTANVRKTPDGLVSVYAVIVAIKGCSATVAGNTYRRLLDEERVPEFAKVWLHEGDVTIRGGNRLATPVTDARGIVQLICGLPGKSDFRRQCADVCVRYIGGDPTLIEEIFQNRFAQETLAREQPDHPARLFGEAVESEAIKRKREELVHAQLDLEIEEALVSRKRLRITHVIESYQLAGIPLDDRARLQLRDLVGSATSTVEPKEICVREFLLSKGINKRYESAFGRAVADLKRAELRAAGLPKTLLKKRIECNGQVISANLYLEDDLPLFEAAFVSKHFQDASVSVRENSKKIRRA